MTMFRSLWRVTSQSQLLRHACPKTVSPVILTRKYSKDGKKEPYIHPYAGQYHNLSHTLKKEWKNLIGGKLKGSHDRVPAETDVVVIGGGAIGMSVAYFLKKDNPESFAVTVVERDPTYTRAATTLSVGGLRQQFSLPENIKMSQFSAEFLQNIKENLSVLAVNFCRSDWSFEKCLSASDVLSDMDPPDVHFNPQGYLFLASQSGVETLKENHAVQQSCNADVVLMNKKELGEKFSWLNTDEIEMGSYGMSNEGWFDPWLYLAAVKTKAASVGVKFVKGEVVGFKKGIEHSQSRGKYDTLDYVHVQTDEDNIYPIRFSSVMNCAGPWSGEIARLAGIGTGEGALSVPLPVEPRKRYVYLVHCPDGPGIDTPLVIDPTGVYFRREGFGGCYLCGSSPPEGVPEPSTDTFDVDYDFFNDYVWPTLAHRVPAFESLKDLTEQELEGDLKVDPTYFSEVVRPLLEKRIPAFKSAELRSAWAGFYDYNYFDQNLIIGNHTHYRNFFMATGCSGHGIQHAPAIGRAMKELFLESEFETIDLSRFSFDRILDNEPVFERNIV